MEVETEPNVYEQYEDYVKQVEVKNWMVYLLKLRMRRMLISLVGKFTMVSKPVVCENDETAEDDKAGDNESVWVPGEMESVLGHQGTLVSLRLPRTRVSLT